MIDLVLVILFCYQMNRMAHERGIASLPYIMNYLAIFVLGMMGVVFFFISMYGSKVLQTPEGIKAAMMFEPFAIMFEVFLFVYFRKRIQKANIPGDNDRDDFNPPRPSSPPAKEKKDLSYFR